ncbi:MAG: peptidylprolyl isomerase [Candidatus Eremiobacteraeota bacterium]|nr:peptidylprolyl isomerase [Candidatus Eremiobacteraeota bacterium]
MLGSLAKATALTVALCGVGVVVSSSYQTLIGLEQKRSIGGSVLAGDLNGSDPHLAARAALAIGRTKDPAGVPLLQRHLRDKNDAVRAMSVYGLGLIGTGASAQALTVAMISDRSGAVRVAALDAIGRYENAHRLPVANELIAASTVGAVLKGDRDPIVRARAATAFEAFRVSPVGDYASRQLLTAWQAERNEDVRWHIMWTIFRGYANRVPRAALTAALHDQNELVRIEAVRAYGKLKNKDAIAALVPLTQDPSWRVQLQALEAIRQLKGEPLTEHLKEMPPGIHTPPVRVQNYAEIAPLPRPSVTGKPGPPTGADAILTPKIYPVSSALMNGPAPGPHPRVRIHTTKGTMIVTLYPEWAPLTVENFLNLTNRGYFDGGRWFRIVPDFVVQTGDPTNTGDGDAGYSIPAEENPLEQRSNVISMGLNYDNNGAIRDSAGTQFYIALSPQLHLNRDFTVFGEVTNGLDVLGRLVETDTMTRVEQIPDSPSETRTSACCRSESSRVRH